MRLSKAVLILTIASSLHAPRAAECFLAPNDLQAIWRFGESYHDSLRGLAAKPSGSIAFGPGQVNQGVSLDGLSSSLRVAAGPLVDLGAGPGMTLELWVNPTKIDTQQPLAEWNDGVAGVIGAHFWIAVSGQTEGTGNLYANLIDTQGQNHVIATESGLLAASSFQHVALTYDKASGTARLYLNGVMIRQADLGVFVPQTTLPLYFGHRPAGTGQDTRFAGVLDEISIYNRALSTDEIEKIHAAGAAGKCLSAEPLELRIQAIPKLTWSSHPGVSYQILRAERLHPNVWSVIVPNFTATGTESIYIDPDLASAHYFYRVELAP